MLPQILLPYTSEQFFSYSPQYLTPQQELEWVIAIADAFPGEDAISNTLILCARHIITHLGELQAAAEDWELDAIHLTWRAGLCLNLRTLLQQYRVTSLNKLLSSCFGDYGAPFNSDGNHYTKEACTGRIWHNPKRIAFTEFLAMQPLAFNEDADLLAI